MILPEGYIFVICPLYMKPRHLIPALLCALLVAYPVSMGPVSIVYYRDYK